jgi:uncharacterized GH25 family protein
MFRKFVLLAMATASLTWAHFVWISPQEMTLAAGQTVKVQLGNGHKFQASESAMSAEGLKVWAVAPSGKKQELTVAKSGNWLAADYQAAEAGVHWFYFVRDRGVMSRTPKGVKPGGKDKNPDATASFKSFGTGFAHSPGKAVQKPMGLPFETIAEVKPGQVVVTVLHDGKPSAGAEVSVSWPGQEEVEIGKTGADGKLTYKVPAGKKGAVLFIGERQDKAPAGAAYDTQNYASTTQVLLP